ncbi:hypothetical protein [Rubinisphaera margarita]|uniref:hypothetical protein n=1 Tax=Rubinisphaera margarita TaxID=2909586 RepID=UPI001EE7F461|nr:hypothetical protein [Rubinisphaera margarita]MCG6155186.1 hypothetical protein [Rubinisphaera margarita]
MTSEEPSTPDLSKPHLPTDRELFSIGALTRLLLYFNGWLFILTYYPVVWFLPRQQVDNPEFNSLPPLIVFTLLMEVAALNGLLIVILRRRLVRARKTLHKGREISAAERAALTIRTDDRDLRIIWLTGLINNGVMAALVLGIAGWRAIQGEIDSSRGMLLGVGLVVLCAVLTTILFRTQLRSLRVYGFALKACGPDARPVS